MPDDRAVGIAETEALFRDINDRLERDVAPVVDSHEELLEFVCECGRRGCRDKIRLSLSEYQDVRADRHRFAVAPDHEFPDVEDVVERTDRYFVVRKHAETWPIVE